MISQNRTCGIKNLFCDIKIYFVISKKHHYLLTSYSICFEITYSIFISQNRFYKFYFVISQNHHYFVVCTFAQTRLSFRYSTMPLINAISKKISRADSNGGLCAIYASSEGSSESAHLHMGRLSERLLQFH